MACKNCKTELRTDYSFCPNCGAKVIRKRLTVKNLWYDFTERYFNLDNTFLITFLHLFTKPQVVIESYINGVRKKYLNPSSYFGISLAISGLVLFIMRKFYMSDMDLDIFGMSMKAETGEKIMNATMDMSSFLFVLYIPIFAVAGWLTFNKKNYLFPEYIITAIYSLAHYNIFSFPISLAVLFISPERFMNYSLLFIAIMIGYALYAANKLNNFSIGERLWRSISFLFLFCIGYFGVSLFLNILFLIFGVLTFEDLKPQ